MKKLSLYLLIGLGLMGCEEVVELDLPTETPRLVIDASLNFGPEESSTQQIYLSLSGGFYQEVNPVVTNATVRLHDLTNTQTFTFQYQPQSEAYETDFIPNFNTDYQLEINYDNQTYRSSVEQAMAAVPIDRLEQGNNTLFEGNEKEVLITYTDSAERDDFYLFDFGYDLFLATKDEFYQGNEFTFSYFYDDSEAGDEVHIKIMGIDERHFDFMTIIVDQTEEGGSPFSSTPTTIRGNLSNTTTPSRYPMGYFRISQTYSSRLMLE